MCKHKMDATPSFGVTMIPEVPSIPQLTLVCIHLPFLGDDIADGYPLWPQLSIYARGRKQTD